MWLLQDKHKERLAAYSCNATGSLMVWLGFKNRATNRNLSPTKMRVEPSNRVQPEISWEISCFFLGHITGCLLICKELVIFLGHITGLGINKITENHEEFVCPVIFFTPLLKAAWFSIGSIRFRVAFWGYLILRTYYVILGWDYLKDLGPKWCKGPSTLSCWGQSFPLPLYQVSQQAGDITKVVMAWIKTQDSGGPPFEISRGPWGANNCGMQAT